MSVRHVFLWRRITKMTVYHLLALVTLMVAAPLGRHLGQASVQETYIEWDYIICLEDIMLREYSRQDYVPYNEEVLEYACIEKLLYPRAQKPALTTAQQNWLNQLLEKTRTDIIQAGTGSIRVRKEYRMLSVAERTAFHNAVNQLKNDAVSFQYEMRFSAIFLRKFVYVAIGNVTDKMLTLPNVILLSCIF